MPAKELLMVRPTVFGYNPETASSNAFQSQPLDASIVQTTAVQEFEKVVQVLQQVGIRVHLFEQNSETISPDAVFPNNWFAHLPNKSLTVFPLQSGKRRTEKRLDIIEYLKKELQPKVFQDMSEWEVEGFFLEGTGSMVFDHPNKIIYAASSIRTHTRALQDFAELQGYRAIWFPTKTSTGVPVYHTNVLMAIGSRVTVICKDVFAEEFDWYGVQQLLIQTGHEVLVIDEWQMQQFCGNILEISLPDGQLAWIMSETARNAFTPAQMAQLSTHHLIVSAAIPTIETVGGGGIRCMLAEIYR